MQLSYAGNGDTTRGLHLVVEGSEKLKRENMFYGSSINYWNAVEGCLAYLTRFSIFTLLNTLLVSLVE